MDKQITPEQYSIIGAIGMVVLMVIIFISVCEYFPLPIGGK